MSDGAASEAVLLLKAAVGQRWFARVFDHPHCWLSERAAKGSKGGEGGGGGKSPRGMIVVYIGRRVKEFCDHFGELGHIPGLNTWAEGAKTEGKEGKEGRERKG